MKIALSQVPRTTTLQLDVTDIDDSAVGLTKTLRVLIVDNIPPKTLRITETLNPYQASTVVPSTSLTIQVPTTPGEKNIYVQIVDESTNSVLDEWMQQDWLVSAAYWSYWETWFWLSLFFLMWIFLITFGILGAVRVSDRYRSSGDKQATAWVAAILGLFPGTALLELVPITMAYIC